MAWGLGFGHRRRGSQLFLSRVMPATFLFHCLRILLSRAGARTKQELLMRAREIGDGSEQGSIPERAQRGRV